MIEISGNNVQQVPMSGQLHAKEAAKRGWRMWAYALHQSYYRLQRPDGKAIEMYGSMPPSTSAVAALHTDDKLATQQILEEHNLPTIEAYTFENEAEVAKQLSDMFADNKKWVVKPLDQAHSFGITAAIADTESLHQAWLRATRFSPKVLVQRYYENPVDLRITCIDGTFAAAARRIPARVKGDGVSTIEALIERENQRPEREDLEFSKLTKIDTEAAEAYLGEAMHEIPAAGEWRQVCGIASASTGGETFDVTDNIPTWLREMAQDAAKALQLPVTGVDMLFSKEPSPQSTQQELKPVIIELNKSPGMRVHENVHHGTPQPMTKLLFDYLATL